MTEQNKIIYLRAAEKDLLEIFEYIYPDNPEAALSLLDKFDQTIANLENFPLIGVVPSDSRLQTLHYRTLVIDNYLVFYVFEKNIIEIRRILHGKRKFNFLL